MARKWLNFSVGIFQVRIVFVATCIVSGSAFVNLSVMNREKEPII